MNRGNSTGNFFLTLQNVMIKHVHILLIIVSFVGFISRIILAEINPHWLKQKWIKITPHVIDTLLLLSGVALIYIGSWFSADYSWIVAKFIALLFYIGFGVVALRRHGKTRWLAFIGAVLCFAYIAQVAVTKQPGFFL